MKLLIGAMYIIASFYLGLVISDVDAQNQSISNVSSSNQNVLGMTTLSDPELGLKLVHPKDWTVSPGYYTSFSIAPADTSLLIYESPSGFKDLSSLSSYDYGNWQRNGTIKFFNSGNDTIAGNPAEISRFSFKWPVEGNFNEYQTTYIKYGDRIFVFEFHAPDYNTFKKYIDDVNEVISSAVCLGCENIALGSPPAKDIYASQQDFQYPSDNEMGIIVTVNIGSAGGEKHSNEEWWVFITPNNFTSPKNNGASIGVPFTVSANKDVYHLPFTFNEEPIEDVTNIISPSGSGGESTYEPYIPENGGFNACISFIGLDGQELSKCVDGRNNPGDQIEHIEVLVE